MKAEASQGHVDDSSILDLCATKGSHSFTFLALGSLLQHAWVNIQCIITKILSQNPYSSSFKRAGVQPHLPHRYGVQGSSNDHRNVHLLFNILSSSKSHLQSFHTGRIAAEQDSDSRPLVNMIPVCPLLVNMTHAKMGL